MFTSPFTSRRKAVSAAALAAVIAAFGFVAGSTSAASADALGSISGTVTSASSGTPLANASVDLDLPGGNYVQFGMTDSNGNYTFTGLPPASYVIDFTPNYGDNYAPQWWNNKPTLATATPISLGAGQVLTNVNASLADGATVTGNVQTAGGPGAYFSVNVVDAAGDYISSGASDSDGNYSINGLPAGSFTVEFQDISSPTPQWWNGQTSLATADFFTTTPDATVSGVNATFGGSASGSVSGTVYGPGTGAAGIANLSVLALSPDGSVAAQGVTGDGGSYSLSGLTPGSYTLEFLNGFAAPTLAPQYWQDEPTLAAADFFSVAAGDALTGYDAHLVPGATITGTVLDGAAGNAPLAGVSVNVVQNGYPAVGYAATDSNGNYSFVGLAAGTYEVEFQPSNSDAVQWWQNAATESTSTPVVTTAGAVTSGINATLQAGGTISGTISGKVSNGTVFPAEDALLAIYSPDGSLFSDSIYAGDDGTYSITNLPAGSYKIYFYPQPDTTDFVPQWWKNKSTEATATPIVIKAGQTRSDINPVFASTALKPSTPHISGSVKVGSTLTAKPGNWKPGTVSFAYQWSRDGVPVDGATGSTYVLSNADANSAITVTVTGSEAGYTTDSITSPATKPVTGGVLSTGTPTISGTTTVGQALSANPGTWGPGSVNLTYKWFRGTARIPGATSSTYALVHSDAGKTITVKVTGAEPGFTTVTVASAPTAVVH
jgi:hypothetical protein